MQGQGASDTPHYENVPFEVPNGWCWCRLNEVADYGKCQATSIEDIDEDSWILELEDIEKDSGKVLKRCTKAEREIKGVRHSFHKGNVLYSKLRTYLNKVLVADEDGFCTTEIMPIECGAYILPTYLCHVLRSKYFLDYTTQCGYGVKMPRLSTADVCKAMIPVAPIEEQKRIAVMIENLDLLIDLLDENKQILQAGILQAKSKILDLAIHGKLVPQDPTDEPASELLKRINPKTAASCDNPHYENTPYNIPQSWCWQSLKSISSQISTKEHQIPTKEVEQSGLIPVVSQSTQIIDGYSNDSGRRVTDIPIILFGDHTRVVKYLDFEFVVGADGTKLIKSHIFDKYLYYWVKATAGHIRDRGYGRHFALLNQEPVPIPPLLEQKRIVARIDELFLLLDLIEKSLQA